MLQRAVAGQAGAGFCVCGSCRHGVVLQDGDGTNCGGAGTGDPAELRFGGNPDRWQTSCHPGCSLARSARSETVHAHRNAGARTTGTSTVASGHRNHPSMPANHAAAPGTPRSPTESSSAARAPARTAQEHTYWRLTSSAGRLQDRARPGEDRAGHTRRTRAVPAQRVPHDPWGPAQP